MPGKDKVFTDADRLLALSKIEKSIPDYRYHLADEECRLSLNVVKEYLEYVVQHSSSENWKKNDYPNSDKADTCNSNARKMLEVVNEFVKEYKDNKDITGASAIGDRFEEYIRKMDEVRLGINDIFIPIVTASKAKADIDFYKKYQKDRDDLNRVTSKIYAINIIAGAIREVKTGNIEETMGIADLINKNKPLLEIRRQGIGQRFFDLIDKFLKKFGEPSLNVKVGIKGSMFVKSAEKALHSVAVPKMQSTIDKSVTYLDRISVINEISKSADDYLSKVREGKNGSKIV